MASTGPNIDDHFIFKDFETKSKKRGLLGDTLGDYNTADKNLTTGNARPPTDQITIKENGQPISDLKLTNVKSNVLTFGLCSVFLESFSLA